MCWPVFGSCSAQCHLPVGTQLVGSLQCLRRRNSKCAKYCESTPSLGSRSLTKEWGCSTSECDSGETGTRKSG